MELKFVKSDHLKKKTEKKRQQLKALKLLLLKHFLNTTKLLKLIKIVLNNLIV